MEFTELLTARRSVRAFTGRKLTKDQINDLLYAAVRAPSACNMQSWHFYVVVNEEIKKQFAKFCAPWIAEAPVVFVVCTDGEAILSRFGERAHTFILQDTALAAENILLAAANMGMNGCFIGSFDPDKCRKLLNIPEKYEIVALIPVGEAKCETPLRERKPIEQVSDIIE